MVFRARQFEFRFPRPTLVMGIVNVTPDSFSDGGKYFSTDATVRHALELVGEGAEILDIGGESTRPGAKPVSDAEELNRVIPVIAKLKGKVKIPISIDTTKPTVALAALGAGASIVNDVAANRGDRVMWRVVSSYNAGYICMHAQGTPQTMQKKPRYKNVVREVGEFFQEWLEKLKTNGIAPEQVVLDPGIGFGKTPEHNLALLAHLGRFTALSRPLLVGVSRKSFLGKFSGPDANERLPASLACAILAVESGAHIIRAHDVLETVHAVRAAEAVLAERKQ